MFVNGETFIFPGCGGNANNFLTLSACQDLAMRGACCYRRFKSTLQSVISSDQKEDKRCEVIILYNYCYQRRTEYIHNHIHKHYSVNYILKAHTEVLYPYKKELLTYI